jgi:metal transporter CNNM
MTPIKDVFMLSIEAKLDYETLRKICLTGHSRVPVYEEVEIPTSSVIEARDKAGVSVSLIGANVTEDGKFMTVKRILGALLVKQVRVCFEKWRWKLTFCIVCAT